LFQKQNKTKQKKKEKKRKERKKRKKKQKKLLMAASNIMLKKLNFPSIMRPFSSE